MFGRAERIVRAVAANSGWYIMRIRIRGFRAACWARRKVPQRCIPYLATPMIVLLGAVDTRDARACANRNARCSGAPIYLRAVERFSTPAGAWRPS